MTTATGKPNRRGNDRMPHPKNGGRNPGKRTPLIGADNTKETHAS